MVTGQHLLFAVVDNAGLAIFAATGAIAAARKKMDLVGTIVLSLVTAVGGGTLRDLFIGEIPIFWLREPRFLGIATGVGIFVFALGHVVALRRNFLLIPDAIGLALYTWIGCEKTSTLGLPWVSVIAIGMITGTAGGILRDMLSGEIPGIFIQCELYATTSITGGIVFILCRDFAPGHPAIAAFACMGTVLGFRLAALRWKIRLPAYQGFVRD